jgi:hypothetical protein
VRAAALERARGAADTVSGFVAAQGLSDVPAKDLVKILQAIQASRAAQSGGSPDASPEASGGAGGLGLSPEELPGAWKALAQVAGKALEDVFEPVAYIENMTTDTEVHGWV